MRILPKWNNLTKSNVVKISYYDSPDLSFDMQLTHWAQTTHICVSKLTSIGSNNGLSPGWPQAIVWTYTGTLLIGILGTNFSEILSETHKFSFKKIRLKTFAKWRPFCLGLNELKVIGSYVWQKSISIRIFTIKILMWCKFQFVLLPIQMMWLLQNLAHDTTAISSWFVHNIAATWWPGTESHTVKWNSYWTESSKWKSLVKWASLRVDVRYHRRLAGYILIDLISTGAWV